MNIVESYVDKAIRRSAWKKASKDLTNPKINPLEKRIRQYHWIIETSAESPTKIIRGNKYDTRTKS